MKSFLTFAAAALAGSGVISQGAVIQPSSEDESALASSTSGCFTNTTVLYQAMLRADSAVETTYIICPDTVIDIGDFDDDGDCCVDGDYTLFLRSNSIVKCGEDGKSANNCVLRGGNTHLLYIESIFGDAMAVNVQVQGITFDGAKFLSAGMANRGDITFTDVFGRCGNYLSRLRSTVGTQPKTPRGRKYREKTHRGCRNHMENPDAVAKHVMSRGFQEKWFQSSIEKAKSLQQGNYGKRNRNLQTGWTMLTIFDSCQFLNNQQGDLFMGGIPIYGLIFGMTPFVPTVIRSSLFEGNVYTGADGGENGYAIQTFSSLSITDSCLEQNQFIGFGPIQVLGGAAFKSRKNWAPEIDETYCNFIASSTSLAPEVVGEFTCHEPELVSCGGIEKSYIKD